MQRLYSHYSNRPTLTRAMLGSLFKATVQTHGLFVCLLAEKDTSIVNLIDDHENRSFLRRYCSDIRARMGFKATLRNSVAHKRSEWMQH